MFPSPHCEWCVILHLVSEAYMRAPNYRMQQTVRPVTSVAGQRPRPAVPQLTRRR